MALKPKVTPRRRRTFEAARRRALSRLRNGLRLQWTPSRDEIQFLQYRGDTACEIRRIECARRCTARARHCGHEATAVRNTTGHIGADAVRGRTSHHPRPADWPLDGGNEGCDSRPSHVRTALLPARRRPSRAGPLRRPFPVEPVRTVDAIHLATAELLDEPPQLVTIVTRDDRIRSNARSLGYAIE